MTSWTIETPQQLTFDSVRSVAIRIVGGHVDILPSDKEPTLQIDDIDGPPVSVEMIGDRLSVVHDQPRRSALSWLRSGERSVAISLAVPAHCRTRVDVVGASVLISGVAESWAKSVSGPVTLDGITETVEATSVSGELEARGLHGPVKLSTASGDVTLAASESDRTKVRTVSGNVVADLQPHPGGLVEFKSVSGDITVRLPDSFGWTIDARSVSGHVGTAFDGLRERHKPGRITTHGRIGDGSTRLSVSTVSGDVALLRHALEASERSSA